jgi:hypothetical protein
MGSREYPNSRDLSLLQVQMRDLEGYKVIIIFAIKLILNHQESRSIEKPQHRSAKNESIQTIIFIQYF